MRSAKTGAGWEKTRRSAEAARAAGRVVRVRIWCREVEGERERVRKVEEERERPQRRLGEPLARVGRAGVASVLVLRSSEVWKLCACSMRRRKRRDKGRAGSHSCGSQSKPHVCPV